jgi:DNA helicase II / ATP-dependent DNA helicase PcrA
MTKTQDFLSHLNPNQRQAVQHFCGPLLVVAGAGSGKTRALTYRIANLILTHGIDPSNILAVTFTNKAAKEMTERIKAIFADQYAIKKYQQGFKKLSAPQQTEINSLVYREIIKHIWIGTFHSLFARILRYDIDKYQDERGRTWLRNFTILDDDDVHKIIKEIVTKQLNLDDKKFDPKQIRYAISGAKNQGLSPRDFEVYKPDFRGRTIAQVYDLYQAKLAENNSLDFDDLLLVPARLLQQNSSVLEYWHRKFHHILVDEYQDTNRIQYELIRLLTTNGEDKKSKWNWQDRSIFVVGDVDQSIYSFRGADYTVLLEFQQDFGDGLDDDQTQTMVKLEENYRSKENILIAANQLIENNSQRIDKILRATKGAGEKIYCHQADNEIEEASFILNQIRQFQRQEPNLNYGDFAILYRMNAQSRAMEDAFLRSGIPYQIIGGFKFYDRKEIKDALAYLKVIINPYDSISLERIINTPKRGIGEATIDRLETAAEQMGIPLWEILIDETSVNSLAGRTAKRIIEFVKVIQGAIATLDKLPPSELLKEILTDSGYITELKNQGTEEADSRLSNLQELSNAMLQFEEENDEPTLENFLSQASLASDLDNLEEGQKAVTLMTLHSAKGLEFPIVFLIGLEQGLLPHSRSMADAKSLEEERRLCYVGITRAQEQLFLTFTQERRLWGYREPASPSQFLKELPKDVINFNVAIKGLANTSSRNSATKSTPKKTTIPAKIDTAPQVDWKVGDRLNHPVFGDGQVTHLLGGGNRITLAIKFPGLGQKIIDPKVAKMQRLD